MPPTSFDPNSIWLEAPKCSVPEHHDLEAELLRERLNARISVDAAKRPPEPPY